MKLKIFETHEIDDEECKKKGFSSQNIQGKVRRIEGITLYCMRWWLKLQKFDLMKKFREKSAGIGEGGVDDLQCVPWV